MKSLQSQAMEAQAGDQKYITHGQHPKTNKHHGVLMINHPTPSGCERWMMLYSDQRGWETGRRAVAEFVAMDPSFANLKQIIADEPTEKTEEPVQARGT